MSELALFGGNPVRNKTFKNKPYITEEEIELVTKLMRDGQFSKFIGSPHENVKELIEYTSKELENLNMESSFLGGEWVRKFEAKWSELVDVEYSISVNSATSGLITALNAIGIKGKKVLTSPISFTATVGAIKLAGGIPVFADIDLETYCLSPESVYENISWNLETVVPVHWCGNAGDFDDVLKICKIKHIIEDAAQVSGTKYKGKYLGTFGTAGVYSFNEPKNISTGEGGMIVTQDKDIAKKCRLIRNHGENLIEGVPIPNLFGYNFRMVELLAAIGYKQIDKLEKLNKIRRDNFNHLLYEFDEWGINEELLPQTITVDNYAAYTASFRWVNKKISRDSFADALRAEGIPVATGIPKLLSENTDDSFKLHNAKKLQKEYIGFFQMGYPNTMEDMHDITLAIDKILANVNELKNYNPSTNFIIGR
jgi:dTDP-4-amino-4,6-dideoxygalactose transaminase